MRRRHVVSVGLLLASLLGACDRSSSPTAPATPQSTPPLPLELVTADFRLVYSQPSSSLMESYASVLEAERPRLMADLGVPSLPRVEGRFYPDAASFTAATGYRATGSVGGPTLFHLVAIPFAPSSAVHELAHNVTLHLEPDAANHPTWLWESVAIYEAGEFVDPRGIPYLAAGDFPTFAELDNRQGRYSIYEVGYTIAEAVVEGWGRDGLRRLVRAHGDSAMALGLPVSELERRWREFVEAGYL